MKAFNFSLDYVLYDLSYSNMIMLSASLPTYESKADREKRLKGQDAIDASDPKNRDKIRALFNQSI